MIRLQWELAFEGLILKAMCDALIVVQPCVSPGLSTCFSGVNLLIASSKEREPRIACFILTPLVI